MKKLTSLVLATGMVLSLAACGGSGSSTAASTTNTDGSTATTDTAAADESNLGYEYGEHFHSDEPVTYTMFFNDNPAYPMNDKWINEGVFKAIEEATNVHLELTVVDNSNYTDKVSLAVSSGTSPYYTMGMNIIAYHCQYFLMCFITAPCFLTVATEASFCAVLGMVLSLLPNINHRSRACVADWVTVSFAGA